MDVIEILKTFLNHWITGEWEDAFKGCQKTWADKKSCDDLQSLLPNDLQSFDIISFTNLGNVRYEIKVKLTFASGNSSIRVANMICETGPYQPAPYGQWGVNPVSILRSLEEKAPDTPAKNKRNGSKKK